LNTNYWLNSGYTAFIPYGNLEITGNTSVSFQVGYFVGSVFTELDSQSIFTYFENDIINLSGYTTAHNLSFKITFNSSVDFSIDLMCGNKTGIVYNGLPDASAGGIVIIYIDDKDYADAQIKYINNVITYKKPVGVQYTLESF